MFLGAKIQGSNIQEEGSDYGYALQPIEECLKTKSRKKCEEIRKKDREFAGNDT